MWGVTLSWITSYRIALHPTTLNVLAHDPCLRVNNPTLCAFCYTTLGRADIEESKSGVDMSSWPPQASYPCGNFSDTTNLDFVKR